MGNLNNLWSYLERGLFIVWGITIVDLLPLLSIKFIALPDKPLGFYFKVISILVSVFSLIGFIVDWYISRKYNNKIKKLEHDIKKEKLNREVMKTEYDKLLKRDKW